MAGRRAIKKPARYLLPVSLVARLTPRENRCCLIQRCQGKVGGPAAIGFLISAVLLVTDACAVGAGTVVAVALLAGGTGALSAVSTAVLDVTGTTGAVAECAGLTADGAG